MRQFIVSTNLREAEVSAHQEAATDTWLVCVMGSVIRTGCYFNKESLNYQVPQIRQNHWVRTLWG